VSNTEIIQASGATREDRLMPAAAYALFFIGMFTGLPIILGAILAYILRGSAGPAMRTHYTFLIRTFWGSILLWIIGGLLLLVGIPLLIVAVGLIPVVIGGAILGLVYLWILLRLVIGSLYLLRGEAHPRPNAWIA